MSVFFDQASLVLVPSGYKSGVVYSQKPMTTDGQLSFTRASTATRVNSSGLIEEVASGVPRLDYLNSSCPRLLLEPTATALNNFSEQLDNAYWTGSAVVTANTDISPDGYQNADTLNDNTTSFLDKRRVITITPNAAHTFSFFVKKTSGALTHYAGMAALLTGGTTRVDYGIINTTTGAINRDASSNINSVSYSSVSYGDYWRVIMTFTDNQSNTSCAIIAYPAISTNGTSINQNAQGSNVFWGLNLTQSSYATSYIPTLGAAVTRGADECSKTGISSLIGQTEGTLFVQMKALENGNTSRRITLSDGTNNNRVAFEYDEIASRIRAYIVGGGLNDGNADADGFNQTQQHKVAIVYNGSALKLFIDGALETTLSTAVTASGMDRIQFNGAIGGNSMYAFVDQLLVFKTALSDADAIALTA